MRIATWNVNSLNARMPRVQSWLTAVAPDVLCLQETKMADEAYRADDGPAAIFRDLGWESVHHGQGQWNGVAILSRVGIEDPVHGFDDGDDEDSDARLIWATCAGVRVGSVYVPNGRAVDDDHYQYKLEWLARLGRVLETKAAPADDLAILGDWNIAPEDRDVWDVKAFAGATHVTAAERDALDALKAWGLQDVFRTRYPETDVLYTFWDYTAGRFHKRQGLRIDYAMATASLAARTDFVVVDRNARKGTKPSDHAPLVVEFSGVS